MEHPPLFFTETPVRDALTRKPSEWNDYEVHCGDCMAFGLVKAVGGGPEMNRLNEKAIERWEQKHGASKLPRP